MTVISGGGLRQMSTMDFFDIIRHPNFDWAIPPVFREKPENPIPRAPEANQIALPPDWADMIHIVPENFLPLDKQKQLKKERFDRISKSPTPEWFNHVTEWMTWLDDVEDFLTTVTVIAIPVTRILFPRLVPYLGWALLAGDIIDLLNVFSILKYAGGEGKRKVSEMSKMNPFGETAKLARAKRLARNVPGLGELFEVVQTTSNLFGIGVELGPLIGFGVASTIELARVDEAQWVQLQQATPIAMAMKLLLTGTPMTSEACWMTNEEYLHVLTAQTLAMQIMEEYYQDHDITEQAKFINVKIPPPPCLNCVTRKVLEEEGIDPDATKRWPGSGGETHLSYMDMQGKHIEKIEKNMIHYMHETPTVAEDRYMGSLNSGTGKRVAIMAGGNKDDWEFKPTDGMILAMRVVERGVYLCDGADWNDWFSYLWDIWNTSVLQNGWTSRGQNFGSSSRVGQRCSKDAFTDPPTLKQY